MIFKPTLLATMLVAFLFVTQPVLACSCMPADDAEEQERALKAFDLIATVQILDIDFSDMGTEPQTYYVRILQLIKGAPSSTEFELRDADAGSCGNYFAIGSRQTVGIDRKAGGGYVLHDACAQLALDGYLAGQRSLNDGGAPLPSLEEY